jgi:hypothetical protein
MFGNASLAKHVLVVLAHLWFSKDIQTYRAVKTFTDSNFKTVVVVAKILHSF